VAPASGQIICTLGDSSIDSRTLHRGRAPVNLPPQDPLLRFRDEAHGCVQIGVIQSADIAVKDPEGALVHPFRLAGGGITGQLDVW